MGKELFAPTLEQLEVASRRAAGGADPRERREDRRRTRRCSCRSRRWSRRSTSCFEILPIVLSSSRCSCSSSRSGRRCTEIIKLPARVARGRGQRRQRREARDGARVRRAQGDAVHDRRAHGADDRVGRWCSREIVQAGDRRAARVLRDCVNYLQFVAGRVVGPRVHGAVRRRAVPRAEPRDADPVDGVLPRQEPEDLPGAVQRRHAARDAQAVLQVGRAERSCGSRSSRGCSWRSRAASCSTPSTSRSSASPMPSRSRGASSCSPARCSSCSRSWSCSGRRAASRPSASSRRTR